MELPEQDIQLFNDSLDVCVANPRFLDVFYEKFIASSPAVAEKFAETNMNRQKRALKASLYSAMLAADGNEPAIRHLRGLGQHHAALAIGAELYLYWRECLLEAVRESGGMTDGRAEEAWKKVLDVAIRIMAPKEPAAGPSTPR